MNYKIPVYYLFLAMSCLGNYLNAQDLFQVKTFTTDNGLPHNYVQSITRDLTGFLWIATWDGLSRYDGYEFRNYFHKPGDSTSFPFFSTDKVLADKWNNVWIFSQGRTPVVYDRAKDSFHPFSFSLEQNLRLKDITIGPGNDVWLSSGTSLFKYNVPEKQLTSFKISGDIDDKLISDNNGPQMVFDNTGGLWIYYSFNYEYRLFKATFLKDSTVIIHNQGSINLNKYKSSQLHNTTGNIDVYISESGRTWLFSRYGLFCLDTAQGRFVENSNPVDPREFKGKPYYIWTEDNTGIHIVDTRNKSLINLKPENENFIETVFIDSSGIVWSGDINPSREDIGLKRYVKNPKNFRHYLTGRDQNNFVNLVFPVLKDKYNDIWVGTRYADGLFQFKPDGTLNEINLDGNSGNHSHTKAISMVQDSGGIWMGATSGQLIYYDYLAGSITRRFPEKSNDKMSLLIAHNLLLCGNSIVINGSKGIYRFIPDTKSLSLHYQHNTDGTGFSFVKDGMNGFWLGSQGNRVIHLDSGLNKTEEFKLGPENNIVEHICIGDSNDIWVALMGGGVGHLYPGSGKTEFFTTDDGLSNNVTYSILKDRKGNLWISTDQGISRFNPHTRSFTNFDKKDGLLISEFDSDSFFQAPDGEMFFGGVGGLAAFWPDSIDKWQSVTKSAPLIITDFKVAGIDRYFRKAVYEMDTLVLNKGDNNFQLNFACLDFQNQEMIRYRYRLSDRNTGWIETDYRNKKINFANLTHRDYTLEIEATSENGVLLNKKSVVISIPHRVTEILWVKVLLILLILTVLVFLTLSYIKQLKLSARKLQDQLRLESLRGQMNPHFIFNSLNSINYFISKEDKISANVYIADFSRLIRSILNNLSNEYIPFGSELESINDYLKLEHLRFGDKFNYSVEINDNPDNGSFQVIPGLVQPFVENAIWHGVRGLEDRTGFVRVKFSIVNRSKIRCTIEDDGIGRKMAGLYRNEIPGHQSRGIEIVRERLKIINRISDNNYRLSIEDLFPEADETGTRVTVDLPARSGDR